MRRIVLSLPVYLALISGIHTFPFKHPEIEPRYSGYGSDGNAVQNGNDAEMGQLNGIYNALINELQNSPKLANGPQAEAQRQADQAHKDELTPGKVGQNTEEPADATDATDATDAPPQPKMQPLPPKQNRVPVNNNFPPPQSQFNGPNNGPFNGPNNGPFNGPGNGPFGGPPSMYTPPGPSPYAPPFGGQGPYGGGGPGPYNQGPYGGYDNGPYQGDYNNPQQQQVPSGNPGSYGADNAALQEQGMGQLGHFFSSMVSELQNSGFNNNVQTAIAPKRAVKPKVRATAATTTTPTTTTEADE